MRYFCVELSCCAYLLSESFSSRASEGRIEISLLRTKKVSLMLSTIPFTLMSDFKSEIHVVVRYGFVN